MRNCYQGAFEDSPEAVLTKVRLEARGHRLDLDLAVANGRVLELTHALSFELPRGEDLIDRVRSLGFVIGQLRENGGFVTSGGRSVDVPDDVDFNIFTIPPASEHGTAALAEAQAVFDEVKATTIDWDNAGAAAKRAVEKYAQAAA